MRLGIESMFDQTYLSNANFLTLRDCKKHVNPFSVKSTQFQDIGKYRELQCLRPQVLVTRSANS